MTTLRLSLRDIPGLDRLTFSLGDGLVAVRVGVGGRSTPPASEGHFAFASLRRTLEVTPLRVLEEEVRDG